MRQRVLLLALVALVGIGGLPVASAATPRTATYRYTANGHIVPGGAITAAVLGVGDNHPHGVSVVPRSKRLTVTVDDASALDGQYVAVVIRQGSRTVFSDCMQVRRPRRFPVAPGRPVLVDVHTIPACPAGPCTMPRVDASVGVRKNDLGVDRGYGIHTAVPVCDGSPPFSSGTTGTLTLSS